MYDRLGELLREALDEGAIPRAEPPQLHEASPVDKDTGGAPVYTQWMERAHVSRMERATRVLHGKKLQTGKVLHSTHTTSYTPSSLTLPPEVSAAYSTLGLAPIATLEEVKAAWREKLKMFHPDSNSNNAVVQKVAKQKTLEVMEAYKVILAYYSPA